MAKIVVLGDEKFTMGFELVGIEAHSIDKLESFFSKTTEIGIIVISQEDYDKLSIKEKTLIDKSIRPIVVILSAEDSKGSNLREQVIRALGVDLLK